MSANFFYFLSFCKQHLIVSLLGNGNALMHASINDLLMYFHNIKISPSINTIYIKYAMSMIPYAFTLQVFTKISQDGK